MKVLVMSAKLSSEKVNEIISKSENDYYVKKVIYHNFEGLEGGVSVSLGLASFFDVGGIQTKKNNDVLNIVNILREKGIDAVPYNCPQAAEPNRFVVDESGISTPIMDAEDALKATTDIVDVLYDKGQRINGYALPKTKENFTYYTDKKQQSIDVLKNNENSEVSKRLAEQGYSVSSFISKQLESLSTLPKINAAEIDAQQKDNPSVIYSGRTCNPYEIINVRRNRDLIYATPSMLTAQGYAKGVNGFNTGDYGFLVGYKATPDQKIYAASMIECGQKSEGTYETDVFSHRNEIDSIYIVNGNDVYKIAGEKGEYINSEWKDFMELHKGYSLASNEFMRQRGNKQKELLEKDDPSAIIPYSRENPLEEFHYDKHISPQDYVKSNFLEAEVSTDSNGKYLIEKQVSFDEKTAIPECINELHIKKARIVNHVCQEDFSSVDELYLENSTLQNGAIVPSSIILKDSQVNKGVDLSQTELTLLSDKASTSLDGFLTDEHIQTAKQIKLSGYFSISDINLIKDKNSIDISGIKLLSFSSIEDYKELSASREDKIPCVITENESSDTSYVFKDAEIDSLNNIGLNNISFDEKIKFQGNCSVGNEMLEKIVAYKDRYDFQAIDNIQFKGLGTEIEGISKLNIPEGASIALDGAFSINDSKELSFLEKCDCKNVGVLMVNDSTEFFNQVKQENKTLPNIPLMIEEDGVAKIVAPLDKKEELIEKFGDNIGKAIYVSPEQFSQEMGVSFSKESSQDKNIIENINLEKQEDNLKTSSHDLGKYLYNLRHGINENLQPQAIDSRQEQIKNNQTSLQKIDSYER